jgi:hypothetical protein
MTAMPADGIPAPGRLAAAAARPPARARAQAWAAWRPAVAEAWRALVVSRLIVVACAVAGSLALRPWSGRAAAFDPLRLIPADGLAGALAAPFARWDAVWLLTIARDGYGDEPQRTAFFPLHPLLLAAGGRLTGSALVAGVVLSLACLFIALVLLHRLAEIELGPEAARTATWALALFPASVYLSAVYAESLFLALSLGAVLAARTDRWWLAGVLGALAAATRSVGVLLLVALVLLWAARPPRRPRSLAWLALVPVGPAAYAAFLAGRGSGALAFLDAQEWWERSAAGPWTGAARGVAEGWAGLGALVPGSGDPLGAHQAMLLAFLLLGLAGVVGCLRRLTPAYGAYLAAGIVAALSSPAAWQPLLSLPRFLVVLFPLFLWLGAAFGPRPAARRALLGASALALAAWSALFGAWTWLA